MLPGWMADVGVNVGWSWGVVMHGELVRRATIVPLRTVCHSCCDACEGASARLERRRRWSFDVRGVGVSGDGEMGSAC